MLPSTRRRRCLLAVAMAAALTLAAPNADSAPVVTAPAAAPPGPSADARLTPGQQQALREGIQIAPKADASAAHVGAARTSTHMEGPTEANPYLSEPTDLRTVDYSHWRRLLAAQGARRAGSATRRTSQLKLARTQEPPLDQREAEPTDVAQANDSQGSSELVQGFGTGRNDNHAALVRGTLADLSVTPVLIPPGAEDNGQLNSATDSTIAGAGAVSTTGVIGDGPHGGEGTMSGDFDFYRLDVSAGLSVTIDTAGSALDTVVALYDGAGVMLGSNDDAPGAFGPSHLVLPVPSAGTYYAMVSGTNVFGPFPQDPHDSGSGTGVGDEGSYDLTLTAGVVDTDYYGLDLAKGDVLGATVGGAASTLTVYRTDEQQMVGADRIDASAVYPPQSPLPGGGNTTLAYVAETTGRYAVRVDGPPGAYDLTVEAYRPGAEQTDYGTGQTLFLDFNGARTNTAIWGGPGVRTLSPFSTFVQQWGIPADQNGELVRRITSNVRRALDRVQSRSADPDVTVNVVNSASGRDPFGKRNVSRVIVGGTRDETGLSTIGLAQFIDPGNFAHEDSAVVMLDLLSEPCAGDGISLNCYLDPYSDRLDFVAHALGNVIVHEDGHLIGNFHTDNADGRTSLMDAGEDDFHSLYGVGPDGLGGTADDTTAGFTIDTYAPVEGFTGVENTRNVSAWGYAKGRR